MSQELEPQTVVGASEPPEAYADYLHRVRLLLQRYVVVLELAAAASPPTGATSRTDDSRADAAWRALFGRALPADRAQTVEALDEQLRQSGSALTSRQWTEESARFEHLRAEFGLSTLECDALWLLIAPHLAPAFMWLYRALSGNPEQTWVETSFLQHVLDPFGHQVLELHQAFSPSGPMVSCALIHVREHGLNTVFEPALSTLRYLVGARPDPADLMAVVALHRCDVNHTDDSRAFPEVVYTRLKAAFSSSRRLLLIGGDNADPLALGLEVCRDQGMGLVEVSVAELVEHGDVGAIRDALREARLCRAGLCLDGVEQLARPSVPPSFVRRIVALLGQTRLPQFYRAVTDLPPSLRLALTRELGAVEIRLTLPSPAERYALWSLHLPTLMDGDKAEEAAQALRGYPLGRQKIVDAVHLARLESRRRSWRRSGVRLSDLETACHDLLSSDLGQLATRVKVNATWDDVVLPPTTRRVIDDLVRYARHQHTVLDDYGYGKGLGHGSGITALFWGPPGTGKTLVSGLLAREMGLGLYQIDLSSVVSKYIGETEDHLARLFDEASQSGMALLFDEADSLFAKRTEVKNSVDRYANLEVNFLLQKIEHHDGLVILTTNFRKSIDEAFMRRLRFKAEFMLPGPAERQLLWRTMIPREAPTANDLPFEALAEVYELTGAEIRSVVLRAAFSAVEADVPLSLQHLDDAARVEYQENGRLLSTTAQAWLASRRARG